MWLWGCEVKIITNLDKTAEVWISFCPLMKMLNAKSKQYSVQSPPITLHTSPRHWAQASHPSAPHAVPQSPHHKRHCRNRHHRHHHKIPPRPAGRVTPEIPEAHALHDDVSNATASQWRPAQVHHNNQTTKTGFYITIIHCMFPLSYPKPCGFCCLPFRSASWPLRFLVDSKYASMP